MAAPPPHLDRLVDAQSLPVGTLRTAHVALRSVRHGTDRNGEGYFDLVVGDTSARMPAKIWGDTKAYAEATQAKLSEIGQQGGAVLKLMFSVGSYRDAIQLTVTRLRVLGESDEWTPDAIWGPGWERIEDLRCKTLVFDIETVPAIDLSAEPEAIARAVSKAAERMQGDTDKAMGLSPYFGKVVSIAIGEGDGDDSETETPVTVLAVAPPGREDAEYPPWIRIMSEAELLRSFWHLADSAELVVSYNGRGFDVPFLQVRSLVHGVPARVDLLSSPYSLRPHLDLFRLLGSGRFGPGATSLDVVCWALGIQSPKDEMDGSMVGPAYARGELEMIAAYNAKDVRATTRVYHHLREHLLPFRNDW